MRHTRTHEQIATQREAREGLVLVLAGLPMLALLSAGMLWRRWTDDQGAMGWFLRAADVGLPLVGALWLTMLGARWAWARRSGAPAPRRSIGRRIARTAVGIWLVLLYPLGHAVMLRSAEVSKERATVVARHALAFHEVNSRWPESIAELRHKSAAPLPGPTFRDGWYLLPAEDGMAITFMCSSFVGERVWELQVPAMEWRTYSR